MKPLLFLIALVALAAAASASDVITLRVAGLAPADSSTPAALAERRILHAFRKRHPQIHVQPAEGLMIEGLGQEIAPLMMIAGGISPDVLYVNFRKIDSYARQGFLYPLDEFIAREERRRPGWTNERILPQVKPVLSRPGPDGTPHEYALPIEYLTMGLYYNRALFRRAGLPLRAPKDWEELVAFSRKIREIDSRNAGMAVNTGPRSSWHLMNFLWSTGAEPVREVTPGEWHATFNTPEAVDAFEFYYQLTEGEKLALRGNVIEMNNSGEIRRVGMQFGYVGSEMVLDPSLWGFGPVPMGPRGIRGAEVNARMLGIYSGVKDPRVREAAWELISFLGSEEARKIRTDSFIEMGLVNQINPADLRRFGYTRFLELAESGLEESFQTTLATARPEPYGKNCNLIYVELTYPLDAILRSPVIADAWKRKDRAALRAEIGKILDAAVARTNERMLGIVPPEVMARRRAVAWSVIAVMVIAFLFFGRAIWKTFSNTGRATAKATGIQKTYAWGLLLIPIGLALAWSYIPLFSGAAMALLDYQLLLRSTFVGIDNFANVLFDSRFWTSLGATVHFAFWMLTAGFFTPILLAYLLHLAPKQRLLFRTIYYLPALFSGAALFILWKQFFSADGLANAFLHLLGIPLSRAWADDGFLAMLSCVIPVVWAGAGPGCLIYLAALKTIPEEQFEASEIDGAGFWSKTVHIILPGLWPLILINLVGAMAGAFQSSQNILIMTGGGPGGATEVAALRIFYEAFMFLNFGKATAMAWILGSLLIGLAVIQLRKLSKMEFRSGGK